MSEVTTPKIKKTMVEALAFVESNGNMSAANLAAFKEQFCYAKTVAGSGQPREFIKLYDELGNVLARKCSILKKWLLAEDYNGDADKSSICRPANKVKAKLTNESKAMERKALEILEEARGCTDTAEKLEKFEAYDEAMEEAKNHRLKEISIKDVDLTGIDTWETVEDVAAELGVEVILEKPKPEKDEEKTGEEE
jgi:hypothetical protein